MQAFPRLLVPKLVLIRATEYRWVHNILNISRKNENVKKAVLEWKPATYPDIDVAH